MDSQPKVVDSSSPQLKNSEDLDFTVLDLLELPAFGHGYFG